MRALAGLALAAGLGLPFFAEAHFQELIPSTDLVTQSSDGRVGITLVFTHPMSGGPVMDMGQPVRFGVVSPQGREDLRPTLEPVHVDGKRAYKAWYRVKRPGDYIFFVAPAPYWEPAEQAMIVQYTKVVVDAYGAGQGWDTDVGLPVEIAPLTRPYGLWTGNLFRGVVKKDGKPAPFAEVEVEWRNDGSVKPPSAPYVTQVVKADASGVFAYAMPRAGWWGFAALVRGDAPMKSPQGIDVPVETGGLIWVRTRDMK